MALQLTRIDRTPRTYALTDVFTAGVPVGVTGVDVALLPPRSPGPTGATVWHAATYASGSFSVLWVGPDGDPTGATFVVPANVDAWMRITNLPQVAAVKLERITVLGGAGLVATPVDRSVPAGGTTGQVLAKASNAAYDTAWVAQTGGSGNAADLGYDVWIIAGQSNASGTNTDYDTTRLDVPTDRVYAYSNFFPYNGTEPMVAVEPLQNGISPGSHFARWMGQLLPGSRRVLLVPLGSGGTSLGGPTVFPRWDATLTGSLFDTMVTTVQSALAAAGSNARLGGVIWAQGENDSSQGRTQAQYTTDLLNLIDYLRTQLSAPTLPFLIIGMVPEVISGGGGYTLIDAAQRAIPAARRYTSFTTGVSGFGNGLHYTAAGQRRNGRNLIGGWTAALANTAAPASTYPLTLARTPSQVTGLTATPGSAQVALSWTAATANGTPVTDYLIEYKTSASGTWLTFTDAVSTATTATVTGLTGGTAYDFRVSAISSAGTGLVSAVVSATPTAGSALSNTVLPTITGSTVQGQVLTASTGTWTPTPDSYTYQWNRAGSAISGATASTYTLVSADVGNTLTVTVTATKAGYTSASATSAATGTVTAGGSTTTETWTGTDGASWPVAWTTAGGTATIQGNRGRLVPTSSYAAALRSAMTGTTGDFDMTVTTSMSGQTGNTNLLVGAADVVGAGANPTNGYAIKLIVIAAGSVGGLVLGRYNSSAETVITQTFPTIAAGVGGWKVRLQRAGTTLQAKIWAADVAEPGTWTITGTDAAPLTTTTLKVRLANGGGSTVINEFDDLSANWA